MNCAQINQIPIVSYLNSIGIQPAKKGFNRYYYHSPFRQESCPSFNVNLNENLWVDHGTGEGGRLVDLIIKLRNCSVSDVIKEFSLKPGFSFHQQEKKCEPASLHKPDILSIEPINDLKLIKYLKSRQISIVKTRSLIYEVKYKLDSNIFKAIGFKNNLGGYEVRNSKFKGCLGKKAISEFNMTESPILVFEGFFDLLSYVSFRKSSKLPAIIVLNSNNLAKDAIAKIKENHISKPIKLFLDNDNSGKETAKFFLNSLKDVEDWSNLYKGFKDFNEMLIDKFSKQNDFNISR